MPASVTPFLMFEGQADEAMNFYVKVIPDSEILNVQRHGPDGPGPEGSIFVASFSLRGQPVMVSDSYISHDFTFTPSISLFVTCQSEEEVAELSTALAEGGQYLMPLDNYGFSRRFAWVVDRFGVSWQVNLP
ncbi:MAG: VOC family protein [Acidobacteria bacterium]|nr:VOC family protein [Acidobacteriota bacterium]MXW71050.1 VOC family protein [Acidobacteriota bacterium]MYE42902.1 VOC family protein [Acidobacteriota bacterium]